MPALELWSGRGMDRVVTLSEVSLTIGSDPESADLALDDPAVSRVHAILEQVGRPGSCGTWARATAPASTASG